MITVILCKNLRSVVLYLFYLSIIVITVVVIISIITGVSENRGSEYSTLNCRILIIRVSK